MVALSLLGMFLSPVSFMANSASGAVDPALAHAKLPLVGSLCTQEGQTQKTLYFSYTCITSGSGLSWTAKQLSYPTPKDYIKGFAIGQALAKDNPGIKNNVLVCSATANNKLVKNNYIQPGKTAAGFSTLFGSYFAYMGCWDGYSNKKSAPKTIAIPDPAHDMIAQANQPPGTSRSVDSDVSDFYQYLVSSFLDSSGSLDSQTGTNTILSYQYPGMFDSTVQSACAANRVADNWSIVSAVPDVNSISYDPTYPYNQTDPVNAQYPQGRLATQPYTEFPIRVFVSITYHDDSNGTYTEAQWYHVIEDGTGNISFFLGVCPYADPQTEQGAWEIPVAPLPFKIPTGKVDKTSNAYKTMFNVGVNFAKVSMASDTALSQCSSALKTGFINARGHPQYLGVQAQMLQSYLRTASGFHGCLDGFGH